MDGSTGVEPTYNNSTGLLTGFTWMPKAEREYQVCFKCHSSFTTLPSYTPTGITKINNPDSSQVPENRDLSIDFSPYQSSFHPVAALGRNRNISSGSFETGWSVDSMVYCADCHTDGSGPHGSPAGSPNLHLLDTGDQICFKCHQSATYETGANPYNTTNFKKDAENLHAFHTSQTVGGEPVTCYSCHNSHGSEQAHLINFDIAQFDVLSGDSQSNWQMDSLTGRGSCSVSCHKFPDPTRQYYYYTP
jgi:hypothetical protein